MKQCSKCKATKELDQFHNSTTTKSGKQSWCIVCLKSYLKTPTAKAARERWKKDNPDRIKEINARWRKKHPEEHRRHVYEWAKKHKDEYVAIQDKYQSKIPPAVYAITYLDTVIYVGKARKPLMRTNVHLSTIKTRNNITKINKLFSFCGYDKKDFAYKILEEGPYDKLLSIEAKYEKHFNAKENYKTLLPDAMTVKEIHRRFFDE